MKRVLLTIFIAAACFGLGSLSKRFAPEQTPFIKSDYGVAPKFELLSSNGETFSSAELSSKFYLLSFFFSSCQGPCPLTNSKLKAVHQEFKGFENFRLVSVTVDPERDDVQTLAKYSQAYSNGDNSWLFLTGSREDITDLTENGYSKFPESPELHTTFLYLVSDKGRIMDIFRASDPAEFDRLTSNLRSVLTYN